MQLSFSTRERVSQLFAVAITVLLLVYLFARYDWQAILHSVGRVEFWPYFPAIFVLLFFYILLITDRLRRVLRLIGLPITIREAWLMRMGGALFKVLIPFYAGELLRLPYLAKRHGAAADRVIGAMAFEKFTTVAGLAPALILRFIFYGELASLAVLIAVCLLLACFSFTWGREWIGRVASLLGAKVGDWSAGLLSAFETAGVGKGLGLIAFATLILAVEAAILALCLRSVGVEIEFARWWTVLPGVLLVALVPVTVAGVGARETALVLLLPNEDPAALVAAGILFFVVARLGVVVLGLPWTPLYLQRILRPDSRKD